jgi:ribosomal protein S18 acetylase RimI-like enzyme
MPSYPLPGGKGIIRRATRADVPAIVRMLADDYLGKDREILTEPLPETYYQAFEEIDADPKQYLAVLEKDGESVGTLHLTFIPGLSNQGARRAQVESVRVASRLRGQKYGEAMLRWAIEQARAQGCKTLQLTTDKSRKDAQRFYTRLGFHSTHEGMKLKL